MFSYLIRRLLYAIPILLGVNIITFALFFAVNSPDDMARAHLGGKHVTNDMIAQWKQSHGYNKPLLFNSEAQGVGHITDTLFVDKSLRLFVFDFGRSDAGRDINHDISQRMWPSLALALPVLIFGLLVNIALALLIVIFRGSWFETVSLIILITMMSISILFYIIFSQYWIGKEMRLVPISGYEPGWHAIKFLILPIIIGVLGGIGAGTRWYRSIFLEEMDKDYVRTAFAKGLSEGRVLLRHVLKNGMLPILTGVVVIIPSLFLGSLLMESFFGIPGLGSYMIDAIRQQDFAIVRAIVFLGSVLYIAGLILTDFSYAAVDPRVRLE